MNYVFSLNQDEIKILADYYSPYIKDTPHEHVLLFFQAPHITVTVYRSLRVLLQGHDAYEDYMMFSEIFGFEPAISTQIDQPVPPESKQTDHGSVIGSDEVGTGDFFGPVVVASVLVRQEDRAFLESFSIRDSKKLTDEVIQQIAPKLISHLKHVVLVTHNEKYNHLIKDGFNLNKIKAYLHNHAIHKLHQQYSTPVDMIVVDQFAPEDRYYDYLKDVPFVERVHLVEKAEDQFLSVACASIIARAAFLQNMAELSQSIGIQLPLGANPVVDLIGKRIALEHGFEIFDKIAKTNFKNLEKIKALMPSPR
ncbi:MAG: ribonuclease HIII [Candidatus Izemoplasmatales bacterium]|nr:ribonuclease HIII [Candidatus Izemoplasmatales bacterium]